MYEYCVMKPTKHSSKKGDEGMIGNITGVELVQSTLYACMELSQQNPLVLLIYANSKTEIKY
jgi:hypothetical protein